MNANNKSRLTVLAIGIAAGISLGAIVGFITGTFDLPVAIIIPFVVVPVGFVTVMYLMKGRDK
jgi:uncharacterized membrane protein (Fun14 family)